VLALTFLTTLGCSSQATCLLDITYSKDVNHTKVHSRPHLVTFPDRANFPPKFETNYSTQNSEIRLPHINFSTIDTKKIF